MNFELTPNAEFLFEWSTLHSFILHHWCQNYSSVLLKLVYVMKCYNDLSFAVLSNGKYYGTHKIQDYQDQDYSVYI